MICRRDISQGELRRPRASLAVSVALVAAALCVAAFASPSRAAAASVEADTADTTAARAYPTAFNTRKAYLRFPAPVGYGRCWRRRIWLKAGTYRWRVFSAHWAHPDDPNTATRRIFLRAGWYLWVDCISYWERVSPNPYRYVYWLRSRLYELSHPGNPATFKNWQQGRPYGVGSYDFGSSLKLRRR